MTTTSEKILQDIKEKHIQPCPKWRFVMKNWIFWVVFILALFVGALSFAVVLDLLVNHDWDIYLRLDKTFWQFMLLSVPYLWFILLVIFGGIAYFDFVHTRGWYHHSVYVVISGIVITSFFLGIIMFFSGIGRKIDVAFDESVPFYGFFNMSKRNIWCHPDKGLLGGRIMKVVIEGPEKFIISDCNGREWEVIKPASEVRPVVIRVGDRIKIIGREVKEHGFEAEELRSW
jgi:hypothetical protein